MDKMILNPGMTIQLGQIMMNRTYSYLVPCLKYYGKDYVKMLGKIFKLAVGIGDVMYVKVNKVMHENHVFILSDPKGPFKRNSTVYYKEREFMELYQDTLEWFRGHSSYETDYPYDDVKNGHLHMLVIKLPNNCRKALKHFKQNQFSRMYTLEEAQKLFLRDSIAYNVITKDQQYHIQFTEHLNREFNTTVSPEDIKELDYHIKLSEEQF